MIARDGTERTREVLARSLGETLLRLGPQGLSRNTAHFLASALAKEAYQATPSSEGSMVFVLSRSHEPVAPPVRHLSEDSLRQERAEAARRTSAHAETLQETVRTERRPRSRKSPA
jgi:hypothetical protein